MKHRLASQEPSLHPEIYGFFVLREVEAIRQIPADHSCRQQVLEALPVSNRLFVVLGELTIVMTAALRVLLADC